MKRMAIAGVMLFSLVDAVVNGEEAPAGSAPGSFLVVKISGHDKELSFKVMSQQEYKVLTAEVAAEQRCWSGAIGAAQKEWKLNPETAKKSFPLNSIVPMKASIYLVLPSEEKATEKLTAIEKIRTSQAELDKKRDEDKNKGKGQKPPSVARAEENKKQLEDQRNELIKKSIELFESKLAEAKNRAAGDAQPAVATSKPEAKPDGKTKK